METASTMEKKVACVQMMIESFWRVQRIGNEPNEEIQQKSPNRFMPYVVHFVIQLTLATFFIHP
jgi:hypothetical protein